MSIKYYHLAKDEELPDEFCAVSDVGGEPSEYTFYVPESEVTKLRELVADMYKSMEVSCQFGHAIPVGTMVHIKNRAIGLRIEVD